MPKNALFLMKNRQAQIPVTHLELRACINLFATEIYANCSHQLPLLVIFH